MNNSATSMVPFRCVPLDAVGFPGYALHRLQRNGRTCIKGIAAAQGDPCRRRFWVEFEVRRKLKAAERLCVRSAVAISCKKQGMGKRLAEATRAIFSAPGSRPSQGMGQGSEDQAGQG